MIDTHTHIDGEEFEQDRDDIIARAKQAGVKAILLPNIDMMSLLAMDESCNLYPDICKPMYGLHPENVDENYMSQLEAIFMAADADDRKVGVGEIGLDLHWDDKYKKEQIEAFKWQIGYAIEHKLPMSIHVRDAFAELYEVFAGYNASELVGVLHCFSGGEEDAKRCVAEYPGMMFGVNGTFTYKKSMLPDIFSKHVPIDRVVLETDAPYLAPVPFRGKKNEPSYLPKIAESLADAYGMTVDEVERVTDSNAIRMYGLV